MLIEKLYHDIYLIRACEKAIKTYYKENEMKTPMHMSEGEEAIVVGICSALFPSDQVFGTYRSHALYLSKTGDVHSFFGELYGKSTGLARGKAGSMHLSDPDHGYMISSAIVASTIPVAVGSAFSNKILKNNKTTVVFFGDGATNEGDFWESLNMACLWKIPIIFVCEDNGFAVHTPQSHRNGYDNLDKIVEKFNCKVFSTNSTDALEIYEIAQKCINISKNQPVFLRAKYYRYLEHVGVNYDYNDGYRDRSELDNWLARDPALILRSRLSEERANEIESEIDDIVEKSIQLAKGADFATFDELKNNVLREM
jgi:pyruvate dehydrogenase E1 component alpha subunit